MNPFELKAALLAKHAQKPVINPHTHGVEHGSNAWLTNSKLPHLACVARSGAVSFWPAICYFSTTIRNISRGLTVWRYACRSTGVLTNNSLINNLRYKHMFRILATFALISACLQVAPLATAATDEQQNSAQPVNAVIEWNRTLLAIVRSPGAQPATIHSTRNFAILHAAIYDAVNNIEPRFSPHLVHLPNVPRSASKIAAADEAAHDVLVFVYPAFQVSLDTELQQDLAQIPDNERKAQGVAVGQAVASQLLAARSADGANVIPPPYIPGNQPGDYQLTPPNFAPADFTQWPQVTPFALERADEFRPDPPPAPTSGLYTEVFNEVKSLGFINSTTRTAEQTEIGQFWNGNIQDFWNEIGQTAALQRHLNLERSARLFALLNISLADTAIAFFEAKYTYNFWRP